MVYGFKKLKENIWNIWNNRLNDYDDLSATDGIEWYSWCIQNKQEITDNIANSIKRNAETTNNYWWFKRNHTNYYNNVIISEYCSSLNDYEKYNSYYDLENAVKYNYLDDLFHYFATKVLKKEQK